MKKKVLFMGESCFVETTEYKGYDQFSGIRYNEHEVTQELREEHGYGFSAPLEPILTPELFWSPVFRPLCFPAGPALK